MGDEEKEGDGVEGGVGWCCDVEATLVMSVARSENEPLPLCSAASIMAATCDLCV